LSGIREVRINLGVERGCARAKKRGVLLQGGGMFKKKKNEKNGWRGAACHLTRKGEEGLERTGAGKKGEWKKNDKEKRKKSRKRDTEYNKVGLEQHYI